MLERSIAMADYKGKRAEEANRGLGSFDYDIEYFAKHHGISIEQARSLIEKFGNDRQALYREVAKLKS
jgi:hypothetical protein